MNQHKDERPSLRINATLTLKKGQKMAHTSLKIVTAESGNTG